MGSPPQTSLMKLPCFTLLVHFVLRPFTAVKKLLVTYIPGTLHTLPHCPLNCPAEMPDEAATEGKATGSAYL